MRGHEAVLFGPPLDLLRDSNQDQGIVTRLFLLQANEEPSFYNEIAEVLQVAAHSA